MTEFNLKADGQVSEQDLRTSSVTLKQTAKGEYYWEIKYYFDGNESSASDVGNKLKHLDEQLRLRFGNTQ